MNDRHRRKRKKSHSRSPIRDPWQEKEERVTVHIINESDDEVTFLGIMKQDGKKENIPKPGEKIVEKMSRWRPGKEHKQLCGELKAVFSKGSHSVLESNIPKLEKQKNDNSISEVVMMHSMSTSAVFKEGNVDHHVFQKYEVSPSQSMKSPSHSLLDQSKGEQTRIGNDSSNVRRVVNGSSGPVVTLGETTNTSNKPARLLKKSANKDIWKSTVPEGTESATRPPVFSRLGTKENLPVFNIQKIPPKRRLEGIKNEAVYTDDTFGDLNTTMTMLEDF